MSSWQWPSGSETSSTGHFRYGCAFSLQAIVIASAIKHYNALPFRCASSCWAVIVKTHISSLINGNHFHNSCASHCNRYRNADNVSVFFFVYHPSDSNCMMKRFVSLAINRNAQYSHSGNRPLLLVYSADIKNGKEVTYVAASLAAFSTEQEKTDNCATTLL